MSVEKSNARVQRMFGQIAHRYDALNHLLSANIDRYWRRRTTRLAAADGSGPILDVCTGTGDLAFAYHRATGGAVPIVGLDFCPEMLAIARAKEIRRKQREAARRGRTPVACGCGGEGIEFCEADAQQLPFIDDSFQIVCVAFGLRNVANTDQGVREMARVCAPGGKVAILEFSMPRRQPAGAVYGFYFRHVLPKIGNALARNGEEAYRYLPESVAEFEPPEKLLARLRDHGLENARRHVFTAGIASLYVGEKPYTVSDSSPQWKAQRQAGDRQGKTVS